MLKAKAFWLLLLISVLSAGCGSGSSGGGDDPAPEDLGDAFKKLAINTDNAEGIANRIWDINTFVDHMVATRFLGLTTADKAQDFNRVCTTGKVNATGERDSRTMIGEFALEFVDCVIEVTKPTGLNIHLRRDLILAKVHLNGKMLLDNKQFDIIRNRPVWSEAIFQNLEWKVISVNGLSDDGNSHYRIKDGRLRVNKYDYKIFRASADASFSILDLSKDKPGSGKTTRVEDYLVRYSLRYSGGALSVERNATKAGTFYYDESVTVAQQEALFVLFNLIGDDGSSMAINEELNLFSGSVSLRMSLNTTGDADPDFFNLIPVNILADDHGPNNSSPDVAWTVSKPSRTAKGTDIFKGELAFLRASATDAQYNFVRFSWDLIEYPSGAKCKQPKANEAFNDNCDWIINGGGVGVNFRAYIAGDYKFELTVFDGDKPENKTVETFILHVLLESPDVPIIETGQAFTSGESVNLHVDATQRGPGSISYEILAGPPGLTIDASGNISWIASTPFFGGEGLSQNIVVGVRNEDRLVTKTLTVDVIDPNADAPVVIPHLKLDAFSSGATIIDTDNDGRGELLFASGTDFIYNVGLHNNNFSMDWVNPYQTKGEGNLKAVRPILDEDGELDRYAIMTTHNILITDLDGKTLYSRALTRQYYGRNVNRFDVADLNGDGEPEIIVSEERNKDYTINVYDLELDRIWSSDLSVRNEFVVGNIDEDDALEIVRADGFVFDGKSFDTEWDYGAEFGSQLLIMDTDGDRIDEIVSLNNGVLRRFDMRIEKQIGTNISMPGVRNNISSFMAMNIDNDGKDEIIIGATDNILVFDVQGNTVTTQWKTDETSVGKITEMAVGDVTGDGIKELVYIGRTIDELTQEQILTFLTLNLDPLLAEEELIPGSIPLREIEWSSRNEELLSGNFRIVRSNAKSHSFFAANVAYQGELAMRVSKVTDDKNTINGKTLFTGNRNLLNFVAADYDGDGDTEIFASQEIEPINLDALLGIDFDIPLAGFSISDFNTGQQVFSGGSSILDILHFPSVVGFGDFNSDGDVDFLGLQVRNIEVPPFLTAELQLKVIDSLATLPAFKLVTGFEETLRADPIKMLVEDIDGDSKNEVIFLEDDAVYIYRLNGRKLEESASAKLRGEPTDMVAADINGDGIMEIVVTMKKFVQVSFDNIIVFNDKLVVQSAIEVYGSADSVAVQDRLVTGDAELCAFIRSASDAELQDLEIDAGAIECVYQPYILVGVRRPDAKRTQVVALDPRSGFAVWRSPVIPGSVIKQLSVIEAADNTQQLHIVTDSAVMIVQ